MAVSVIVITLNEVSSIARVLDEIPKDIVDEILVVDGHSSDSTPELVKKLGYKVIPQEGKGFGRAFPTGAKYAKGDTLILMNGDGSMDPKYIPDFLKKMKEGYKVVFASRYLKGAGSQDDTLLTYIGNKIFTFLVNVIHGVGISDTLFTYLAVDKDLFNGLGLRRHGFEMCVELPIRIHRQGNRFGEIPSHERARFHGTKKVNEFVDGLKILWAVIEEVFR